MRKENFTRVLSVMFSPTQYMRIYTGAVREKITMGQYVRRAMEQYWMRDDVNTEGDSHE